MTFSLKDPPVFLSCCYVSGLDLVLDAVFVIEVVVVVVLYLCKALPSRGPFSGSDDDSGLGSIFGLSGFDYLQVPS